MSRNQSFFQSLRRTASPLRGVVAAATPNRRRKTPEELFEEARLASQRWSARTPDLGESLPIYSEDAEQFEEPNSRPPYRDSIPPDRNEQDTSEPVRDGHAGGPFSGAQLASPAIDRNSGWLRRSGGPFSFRGSVLVSLPGIAVEDITAAHVGSDHPILPSEASRSNPAPSQGTIVTPVLQKGGVVRVKPATWVGWLQNVTGYSTLSHPERNALLGLYVTTPLLLWGLEYAFPGLLWGSNSSSAGVTNRATSMTYFDVLCSVVLGVLLSFTFDANTAATDAYIRNLWRTVRTAVSDTRSQEQKETALQSTTRVSTGIPVPWHPSPVLTRFAAVVVLFAYCTKAAVVAVHTRVVGVATRYARSALLVAACAVLAYGVLVGALAYLRHRRARTAVVDDLATMTKALLLQKERAYPIPYLLEEVSDAITVTALGPVLSPKPVSAVLASVVAETSSPSAIEGDSVGGETVSDLRSRDILKGFALRSLWKEVQRAVERDSRIQKVDLIVDGKKQPCWRVLTGSTNARI